MLALQDCESIFAWPTTHAIFSLALKFGLLTDVTELNLGRNTCHRDDAFRDRRMTKACDGWSFGGLVYATKLECRAADRARPARSDDEGHGMNAPFITMNALAILFVIRTTRHASCYDMTHDCHTLSSSTAVLQLQQLHRPAADRARPAQSDDVWHGMNAPFITMRA